MSMSRAAKGSPNVRKVNIMIKRLKKYLLNYNIGMMFERAFPDELVPEPKKFSRAEKEQFWRMVFYRDTGRW